MRVKANLMLLLNVDFGKCGESVWRLTKWWHICPWWCVGVQVTSNSFTKALVLGRNLILVFHSPSVSKILRLTNISRNAATIIVFFTKNES